MTGTVLHGTIVFAAGGHGQVAVRQGVATKSKKGGSKRGFRTVLEYKENTKKKRFRIISCHGPLAEELGRKSLRHG